MTTPEHDHDSRCTTMHSAHTQRAPLDSIRMADPTHPDYVGLPLLERIAVMREKGNEHLCPITPNEVLLLADVATAWTGIMRNPMCASFLSQAMSALASIVGTVQDDGTMGLLEAVTPDLTVGYVALSDEMLSSYDASRPHAYANPATKAGKKWMKEVDAGDLKPYPTLCDCASPALMAVREAHRKQGGK